MPTSNATEARAEATTRDEVEAALRATSGWPRHDSCGWVCLHCGYHARRQVARDVHERRALRGLDCVESAQAIN